MLATQLNHMVTSNAIQRNGIIKLTKYLCNIVSGRRIVIILGIDVLSGDVGEVIGSPQLIPDDNDAGGKTSPAPLAEPVPNFVAQAAAIAPVAAKVHEWTSLD